jgi:hypothetical protein
MRKLFKLGVLAGLAAVAARLLRRQAPPEPGVGQAAAPPPPAASEPATIAPDPAPTEPGPPQAEQESADEGVEGYCMRERKHVRIKDPEHTVAKNGREAVRGTCPDCGSTIFRFV